MWRHYITVVYMGNVAIYYKEIKGVVYVECRKRVRDTIQKMRFLLDGTLVSNGGFSDSYVDFYREFIMRHSSGILMELRGLI